jgi:hypothetical protein
MSKKWEAPIILAVDGLPKTLGDCIAGSTDGVTTGGGYCGCHNGENTLGSSVRAAGIPDGASDDGCSVGGTPSTCFCGTAAAFPS